MLNERNLKLGHEIAASLEYSNKNLLPVPQGPIDTIMKALYLDNATIDNGTILEVAEVKTSVMGSYEQVLTKVAHTYSNIVSNIVNAARNTVKPLVDRIFEEVHKSNQSSLLEGTNLFKEIIQLVPPRILYDEQFVNLLGEYKEVIYPNLNELKDILPVLNHVFSSDELYDLTLTGSPLIDGKLREVIKPNSVLSLAPDYNHSADMIPFIPALTLFMLLQGVINRRSDKVDSMFEGELLESQVLSMRNAVGGALHRLSKEFIDDIEQNRIFCKRPRLYCVSPEMHDYDQEQIYVYAKAYQEWIAGSNGSIEALLGFVAEHPNELFNENLIKDAKRYEEIYHQKIRSLDIVKSLNDITRIRKITHTIMESYLNVNNDGTTAELILQHQRLAAAIAHDYHGPNDLVPYLIKVVARTLYPSFNSKIEELNKSDVKDVLLETFALTSDVAEPDHEMALFIATTRLVMKKLSKELIIV
jgi:hypothetical protein